MFDKKGAMGAIIDGVPCMHILNSLELEAVAEFLGINPGNEAQFLKRVSPKIYLRLDLPQDQLLEVWKLLMMVNPTDRH